MSVSNDELVTVREAMRGLNRFVEELQRGERDKLVLTKHGQMMAAVVPLRFIEERSS